MTMNGSAARVQGFARDNPVITALFAFVAAIMVAAALVTVYWPNLVEVHLPKIVGYAIGWFIAMGSTLAMAFFLMWAHDRREIDRSRRTIRLNFDQALLAMLELARRFTTQTDRSEISDAIERSQKQLIAASARLKRYENRLTSFPPSALIAYSDLENEIDLALEDLNDLHRKSRVERDSKFPGFGYDVLDRLSRFNEHLRMIHSRETDASREFENQRTALGDVPVTPPVVSDTPAVIRRAGQHG